MFYIYSVAITENHIATSYGIKNCTRIDHLDIEKYQPDPLTNEPANVIPCKYTCLKNRKHCHVESQ